MEGQIKNLQEQLQAIQALLESKEIDKEKLIEMCYQLEWDTEYLTILAKES